MEKWMLEFELKGCRSREKGMRADIERLFRKTRKQKKEIKYYKQMYGDAKINEKHYYELIKENENLKKELRTIKIQYEYKDYYRYCPICNQWKRSEDLVCSATCIKAAKVKRAANKPTIDLTVDEFIKEVRWKVKTLQKK